MLTTCWSSVDSGPLWLLSCEQQSLEYSNMCDLLWSHVEYRIVFFIYLPTGAFPADVANLI